ncbi:hypothetical protein PAE4_30083 [Bacillus altitudinis]|uniref:Uncharacterized protein n=1 Tax=Bacillus altitudinis TaxID=293387 RepID=A0A653PMG5_BACAB|nr:hypothetical protein PAE4_30083 [Bacillus altitudinis]VXB30947.1 hypothetical protein BACI348_40429 [Bacillus altitudinis]
MNIFYSKIKFNVKKRRKVNHFWFFIRLIGGTVRFASIACQTDYV